MFYSQFILAKKGPLGTIWIAAHLERKLRKTQVAETDIGVTVDSILCPEVPIALRLSGHLLLGVVRIYSRQVNYLFNDCSETLGKIKQAFQSAAVDLPPEATTAPFHTITLPETFDFDELELVPDSENSFLHLNGKFVDQNVTTREQITLQDTVDHNPYLGSSQFGLDERFGDGTYSSLGLEFDEEFLADKGGSSCGPSTLTSLPKEDITLLPSENGNTAISVRQDVAAQSIGWENEITPMEIDNHCEPVKSGPHGVDSVEGKANGILGSPGRDISSILLNQGLALDPPIKHTVLNTSGKDFEFDNSKHEGPGHALRTLEACTPDLNQEYRPPDEPSTPALVDETSLPMYKEVALRNSGNLLPALMEHSERIIASEIAAESLPLQHVHFENFRKLPILSNEPPERMGMPETIPGTSSPPQRDNPLVSSNSEEVQILSSASFPGFNFCQRSANSEVNREGSAQLGNVLTCSVKENTCALNSVAESVQLFPAKESLASVPTTFPNFTEQAIPQQSRTEVLHEGARYPANALDSFLTPSSASFPSFTMPSLSVDSHQVNVLNQVSSAPSQQQGLSVSPEPVDLRVGTEASSSQPLCTLLNTVTNAQDSKSAFISPSDVGSHVGLSVSYHSLQQSTKAGTDPASWQVPSTLPNTMTSEQDPRLSLMSSASISPPMARPYSPLVSVGVETQPPTASPYSPLVSISADAQPPSFRPPSRLLNTMIDGQGSGASFSPSTGINPPTVGSHAAEITATVGLELPTSFQLPNASLDAMIGGHGSKASFAPPTSIDPHCSQKIVIVSTEPPSFQLPNTGLDTTISVQSSNKSSASLTNINHQVAGPYSSQTIAVVGTETDQSSKASFGAPTGANLPIVGPYSLQTMAGGGSESAVFRLPHADLDMRTDGQSAKASFTCPTTINSPVVSPYSPQAFVSTGSDPPSLQMPNTGLNTMIRGQDSKPSAVSLAGMKSLSASPFNLQASDGMGSVPLAIHSLSTGLNAMVCGKGSDVSFASPTGHPPSGPYVQGPYVPQMLECVGTEPPSLQSSSAGANITIGGGQGSKALFTSSTGMNPVSVGQYSPQNLVGVGTAPLSVQLASTPLKTMTGGQMSRPSFASPSGINPQMVGPYIPQTLLGPGPETTDFRPASMLLNPLTGGQLSKGSLISPTYMNSPQVASTEIHVPKENVLPSRYVEHLGMEKNFSADKGSFWQPAAQQSLASSFSDKNPSTAPRALCQSDLSSLAGIDTLKSPMSMGPCETLRSGHVLQGRTANISLFQQGFSDERMPGLELDRSRFRTPSMEMPMQELLMSESVKTPVSRDEKFSAATRPSILSIPSLGSVPRDDDVLASILGQRAKGFNVISTPNVPKPPKASTVTKRTKLLSRTTPKRRKVELDPIAVLHGDVIRQQLANTEDIHRERRKAPCTRREVWRFLRECEGQENFDEPTLPELSSELNELYHDVVHGRESRPLNVATEGKEASLEAELDNIEDSDLLAHYVKRISMKDSCLSQGTDITENSLPENNFEQGFPNADVRSSYAPGSVDDGSLKMALDLPKEVREEEVASQQNLATDLMRPGDAEMPRTEKPFEPNVDEREGPVLNKNGGQVYSHCEVQVEKDAKSRDILGTDTEEQGTKTEKQGSTAFSGQEQGFSLVHCFPENAQPPGTSLVNCLPEGPQVHNISLVNCLPEGPQVHNVSLVSCFPEGSQVQDTSSVRCFPEGAQRQDTSSCFPEDAQAQVSSFQQGSQLQNTSMVSGFPEGAQPQDTLPVCGFPEGAQHHVTALISSFQQGSELQNTSMVSGFPEGAQHHVTALISSFPEDVQQQVTSLVSCFPEGAQQQGSSPFRGSADGAQLQGPSFVTGFPGYVLPQATSLANGFPEGAEPQATASVNCFREGVQLRDTSLVDGFTAGALRQTTYISSNFPEGTEQQDTLMPSQWQGGSMASGFPQDARLQDTSMLDRFSEGAKEADKQGIQETMNPDQIMTVEQKQPSVGLDMQDSFEKRIIAVGEDGTQPLYKEVSGNNAVELPVCQAACIDNGKAKEAEGEMTTSALFEEETHHRENDEEMAVAEPEGDTDCVDDNNDIAYAEIGYSSDEQDITIQDESGWSTRSRNVGKYLKTVFQDMENGSKRFDQKKMLGLDRLLARRTRREAARMFFETLVLKTKDYIHVEQNDAYQDILLYPNSKLLKAEF